jgi:hypothetical protein
MTLTRPAPADLAARLFGATPARRLALLRAAWPLAAGPELARRTDVVALDGTTLRVKVADASWRKELLRVSPALASRLRRVAGALAPERLAFCEGEVTPAASTSPAPGRPPEPAPALSPALETAAARIQDAALRDGFRAAAARYLARSASTRSPQ